MGLVWAGYLYTCWHLLPPWPTHSWVHPLPILLIPATGGVVYIPTGLPPSNHHTYPLDYYLPTTIYPPVHTLYMEYVFY